jgi:antitoxin component YwqK of YwqJK toxin-antitoxin module
MNMGIKISLLLCCMLLSSSITVLAQEVTAAEIKTRKIKKKTTVTTATDPNYNPTVVYYYDAEGNDTAVYVNGGLMRTKVIKYNTDGKLVSITAYGFDKKPKELTSYSYKPDGGFTEIIKTSGSKRIVTSIYDRNSRMLRSRISGESRISCRYDKNGHLIKQLAFSTSGALLSTTVYRYDTTGKLTGTATTGERANTDVYEYDDGLLKKVTMTFPEVVFYYTCTYEY